MPYSWDSISKRYKDPQGRFFPETEVKKLLNIAIDHKAVTRLTLDYKNDLISRETWHTAFRAQVKKAYLQAAMLAAGGKDAMTPQLYGKVGGHVAEQFYHLDRKANNFLDSIEDLTPKQAAARAKMYIESCRQVFEEIYRDNKLALGAVFERWWLSPKESCFVAGTKILTPDGGMPIEDIQLGDLVQTLNGPKQVTKLYEREYTGSLIAIEKGDHRILCTPNHPFLTSSGRWIPAVFLKVENSVLYEDIFNGNQIHVGLPDSSSDITLSTKFCIPSFIINLLRCLSFGKRLKSRMSMPIVPISFNDKVTDNHITDIGVDNNLFSIFYIQAIEYVEKLLLKFVRIGKFHVPMASDKVLCRVRLNSLLSKSFRCPRSLRRIVLSHILSGTAFMNSFRISFFSKLYTVFVRHILNLFSSIPQFFRKFIGAFSGVSLTDHRNMLISENETPHPFLGVRMVPMAIGFGSSVSNMPTNLTPNSFDHFLLPPIVSVSAFEGTETVTGFRIGLTTQFTDFSHGISPLHLHSVHYNTEPTICKVYNLEVEDVHHYVANGFVVHNCDDCLDLAKLGIVPIGTLGTVPGAGETECLTNCGCSIRYYAQNRRMLREYLVLMLGGKGSGHHGHRSEKGKRGGSLPKGGFSIRTEQFSEEDTNLIKNLLQSMPESHTDGLEILGTTQNYVEPGAMGNYREAFGKDGKPQLLIFEPNEYVVLHELGHHMQHKSGAFLYDELSSGKLDIPKLMSEGKIVKQNFWKYGLTEWESSSPSEQFAGMYRIFAKGYMGQERATKDVAALTKDVPYISSRIADLFNKPLALRELSTYEVVSYMLSTNEPFDIYLDTPIGDVIVPHKMLNEHFVTKLGGPGSGHHSHRGREGQRGGSLPKGSAGVGSIADSAVEALKQIQPNAYKDNLIDMFALEFPDALKAVGISPNDVEEIWVYGSFNSSKEEPSDIDLIMLTREGIKFPNAEWADDTGSKQWDWNTWFEDKAASINFTNHRSVIDGFLTDLPEYAPRYYDAPKRIYAKTD